MQSGELCRGCGGFFLLASWLTGTRLLPEPANISGLNPGFPACFSLPVGSQCVGLSRWLRENVEQVFKGFIFNAKFRSGDCNDAEEGAHPSEHLQFSLNGIKTRQECVWKRLGVTQGKPAFWDS